jgi:hypothetical protein
MLTLTLEKSQLSAKEVETTQKIAHVRIRVERAIEKVKNVNILCANMSTVCIWYVLRSKVFDLINCVERHFQ